MYHCVDSIAVPLGILETFERHHPYTFAEHRAVGFVGKRTAVTAWRKCGSFAEAHEHEDVVHRINTTGDHYVGITELKLENERMASRERERSVALLVSVSEP